MADKNALDGAAVLNLLEAIDENVVAADYAVTYGHNYMVHLDAIEKYVAEIREAIYRAGLQGDYD